MTVRADLNQQMQIGPEITPGTSVAAGKMLNSMTFEQGINLAIAKFRAQGRRFPTATQQGKDFTDYSITGFQDFNQITYLFDSLWGHVSPTTPGGGTNSRQRVWTPALTGSTLGTTYTIQKGDANFAEQASYVFCEGVQLKANRNESSLNGAMKARKLLTGQTLTSNPTNVTPMAVQPAGWDVYSDASFGSLGNTQLSGAPDFTFTYDSAYDTFWPLKSSNSSFDQPVDIEPKAGITLMQMADTAGVANIANARAGSTFYMRFLNTGPVIESTIHYSLQIDCAVQVVQPKKFMKGDGSVYAIEYELEFFDDASAGYAFKVTLVNTVAAL